MTKTSQCRASAFRQPSWIISVTRGGSQNTRSPVHSESFLLVSRDDEFAWQTEVLRVLRAQRERRLIRGSDPLAATGSCLSLGQLLALQGSCVVRRAPETTIMSSRTSGLNKVISVQHVSKCGAKIRYEQMDGFSCSMSLWWILWALLPVVCLFSILEHFFPRYKIQYLKVGSGKVDQVILRLILQMCLFIHVWNTFFPQITGHVKS